MCIDRHLTKGVGARTGENPPLPLPLISSQISAQSFDREYQQMRVSS